MLKTTLIRLLRAAAQLRPSASSAVQLPARSDLGYSRKTLSSLDMTDGTRVIVKLNGREVSGIYRGAAPDGSYAVLLDDGRLMAFDSVSIGS